MQKKRNQILLKIVPALVLSILLLVISMTGLLFSVDRILADPLYQRQSNPNQDIKIITIDEKSIQTYGDFSTWDRQIYADLVDYLNENPDYAPSVIAFDVMFVSDRDSVGDQAFAESCRKAGNVISAVNLVYRNKVSLSLNGRLKVDKENVELAEFPYESLRENVGVGFANTILDKDGYVRHSRSKASYQGMELGSIAYEAARVYSQSKNSSLPQMKTNEDGVFGFTYTGKSGSYEKWSLCDVLAGKYDPRLFAGKLIYVGAYAPGLQDSYSVPIQKGHQMYGVEINANITEALLEGRTHQSANSILYAFLTVLVFLLFVICCELPKKKEVLIQTIALLIFVLGELFICSLLYKKGIELPVLYLPLIQLVFYGWCICKGYFIERFRRHLVLGAFRKYVAPQVVDQMSKTGEFEIKLGGEHRDIAVLFVDIRGFTPMSESLEPEDVVEILNEYLDLTTNSIFKNGGTLDKFIGDATMAVFNAPFDLEDYIYRAVCTARDIAAGSDALEKKLMERFGKSVSFGIGVNCGPAVVGNIGSNFRMDYTAIGDTVNTAARLEANAKRGQILISDTVYEALKDRIKVTDVGVIPLKGKSNGVYVYQLDEVL